MIVVEALDSLTESDLAALASALATGRLRAPFNCLSLQAIGIASEPVAAALQRLHDEGMRLSHLVLLVDSLRRSSGRHQLGMQSVELVCTGPEATGVAHRDTAVVVRELFASAETEVLVAGFAVYQGRAIFQRLAERMTERPLLRARFFLDVQRRMGDTSPAPDLMREFVTRFRVHEWPGERMPELYFDPRSTDPEAEKRSSLHAKCVVVDRRAALVTSANFTEAAQSRNIEIGVLVRDAKFASEIGQHFDWLVSAKVLMPMTF